MEKNKTEYLLAKLEILLNELHELIEVEDQTRMEVVSDLAAELSDFVEEELLCLNCDCEGCENINEKLL